MDAAHAIFDDIETFVDKLDGLDDVEVADGPEKETVVGMGKLDDNEEVYEEFFESISKATDGAE